MPALDGSAGPRQMSVLPIIQKATAPPGSASEAVSSFALQTKGSQQNDHHLPDLSSARKVGAHQAAAALRPPRHLAMVGVTDPRLPVGLLRDISFERDVVKLHHHGPRAIVELLRDVGGQTMRMTAIEARVANFADLDPSVVNALGGDRFAMPPLTVVRSADEEPAA